MDISNTQFKAITAGLFNAITVTKRLRVMWEAITSLDERLKAVECGADAQTTHEATVTIAEPVEASEPAISAVDVNSWRAITDTAALKEFALDAYGLEIKGNKKAETIIAEIDTYLAKKTEG